MLIKFILNGKPVTIDGEGSKRLLDFIREDLKLTGTKEGCGIGECGACTVILNKEAILSCLAVAGQLDGNELWTIEGLTQSGDLDAIQQAFINNGAIQCGFCTSGMIMSVKALLMKNPNPTDEVIRRSLAGNICRCTGYQEVLAAVNEVTRRRCDHDI